MSESTFLSRSFGDQGVRLRIRKETRLVSGFTVCWIVSCLTSLSKRPASRDANPAESQGYAQPRQDGAIHAQLGYPTSAYAQPAPRDYRHDYGEPMIKRQRSVGPYDRSAHEAWPAAYSSHSLPQTSTYGQVGTTNAPSMETFAFRSPMPDYGSAQASNPYDPQRSYGQDSAAQYVDSQASCKPIVHSLTVDRHTSSTDHLHYQEMNRYGAVSAADQRETKYTYPAPPQPGYSATENGSILPPLSASGASAQSMGASASPYTYNTADGRYATHPGSQANVQGTRPPYGAGYPTRKAPRPAFFID